MDYYFYDQMGQRIHLTFAQSKFVEAKHVLIFAFDEAKTHFLLTEHKKRGWELPGGKVERDERGEEAARRELFEETGAVADAFHLIGQYAIEEIAVVKNVYIATVKTLGPLPCGYETESVCWVDGAILAYEESFSPFMQDNVFPLCMKHIKKWLSQMN